MCISSNWSKVCSCFQCFILWNTTSWGGYFLMLLWVCISAKWSNLAYNDLTCSDPSRHLTLHYYKHVFQHKKIQLIHIFRRQSGQFFCGCMFLSRGTYYQITYLISANRMSRKNKSVYNYSSNLSFISRKGFLWSLWLRAPLEVNGSLSNKRPVFVSGPLSLDIPEKLKAGKQLFVPLAWMKKTKTKGSEDTSCLNKLCPPPVSIEWDDGCVYTPWISKHIFWEQNLRNTIFII